MRRNLSLFDVLRITALSACVGALAGSFLHFGGTVHAQVGGETDINLSQKEGPERECAISKNPSNKDQLFIACNSDLSGGLFAASSVNGGATWTYPDEVDKTVADGDEGQGTKASWDPSLAWDTLGNLYLAYLGYPNPGKNVVVLWSQNGGETFQELASFGQDETNDQPTIVASPPGAPPAVWIVWHQNNEMRAIGAKVRDLGAIDPWGPLQTIKAGGVDANDEPVGCSYGDVAISPTGIVVQACQSPLDGEGPSKVYVNTDADGLGAGDFGPAVTATSTNVGGIDEITPLSQRTNADAWRWTDAEVGLAYDSNVGSPHFGRLYLVYTEEVVDEHNDTDIMLRFSDDNGATWSDPPIRVNNDPPGRSQFLPRIAANPVSGNIAVCWLDARNSPDNRSVEKFCAIATPTGESPSFTDNVPMSDGSSTRTFGSGIEFGDYSGLAYFEGAHPVWADMSNSTGDNPGSGDPSSPLSFDAYTDRLGWTAASEGEPHITTVDGVHYDFQSAGEFVALRGDGLEIQTRQTAIATPFPGPDPYTELATCVSLNSGVAARVGRYRVTYQPDPWLRGFQLRVEGTPQSLDARGIDLGPNGRIVRSSFGDGIEIEFPNGSHLIATPGWWASQRKWFLNVNIYRTTATEGIMGVIARDGWLPALPDGTSLGRRPDALSDRYAGLNRTFADKWRVTGTTSLFDYETGTSTANFTLLGWPLPKPPCVVPREPRPGPSTPEGIARTACGGIADKNRMANCIFDVTATGEMGFGRTYLVTERLEAGATTTALHGDKRTSRVGEMVIFSAQVARKASRARSAPPGTVQFMLDGAKVGTPVTLDKKGRATWKTSTLKVGKYEIAAQYIPTGNVFLPSRSRTELHAVTDQFNK